MGMLDALDDNLYEQEQEAPVIPELTSESGGNVTDNHVSEGYKWSDLKAAYRRQYSIGSNILSAAENIHESAANVAEDGFNLSESLDTAVRNGDITEDDRGYFNDCASTRYFNHKIDNVKQELRDKELIERAGTWDSITAGFVGGFVEDPATYTSFGASGVVKAANLGMKAIMRASAVQGAKYAAMSSGIRYMGQTTMSADQAVIESAAGGIISGILGGAAAGIKKSTYDGWIKGMTNFVADSAPYHALEDLGGELYSKTIDPILGLVKEKVAPTLKKILYNSPFLQGVKDDWQPIRDIIPDLFRSNNFVTDTIKEGGTHQLSAEGQKNFRLNQWDQVKNKYEKIFENFLKTEEAKQQNWNEQRFNLEVSRYIRDTSVDFTGKEGIKFSHIGESTGKEIPAAIQEAGKSFVRFWDELLRDARKYGVISGDYAKSKGVNALSAVLTKEEAAMSAETLSQAIAAGKVNDSKLTSFGHFTRIYVKEQVHENENLLRDLLYKSNLMKNPGASNKQLQKEVSSQLSHIKGLDLDDRLAIDNFDFKGTIGGNFTRKRSVSITDDLLEPFLVNNPLEIGDAMISKLSGAIELNRVAHGKGYKSWKHLIDKFSEMRNLENKFEGDASKAYDSATKDKMQLMYDSADLIMGNYGKSNNKLVKIAEGAKVWNVFNQLGGVALSSIPDISAVVAKFKLSGLAKNIDMPFMGNKIYKEQGMDKVFSASEVSLATTRIFDNTYTHKSGTWQTIKRDARNTFSKMSLLPYWNNYWKNLVKTTHYDDIIESALRNTENDALFLRQNRISREMRDALVTEYNKIGYMHDKIHMMPMDRIENDQLRRTLFEALETASNETIMTPGAGDIPRWLKSSTGKALTQYKTFVFAQTNNLLLPMISQKSRHGDIPKYLATALSLGVLTASAKRKIRTQEIDFSDHNFWSEAVGVSGCLGYIYDIYDIGERIYNRRTHWLDVISPQAGLATNIKDTLVSATSKKKMTEGQLKKASRLIPFNNLFYLRPFVDHGIHEHSVYSGRKLIKRKKK